MLDPTALPFSAQVAPDARPATRLTWDSREASPEVAFVALPGEQMHGNTFVNQALQNGAPFVLTDLDVPRAVRVPDAREALFAWARHQRQRATLVVGISGTVGKTTAKNYAGAALQARFLPVFNTMPAIACFLIEESGSGSPLVVELGIDRVGEMAELMALVSPDVGVVTSIGQTHFEDERVTAREKGVLLSAPRRLVGMQAAPFFPGVETYGFEGATHAGAELQLSPEAAHFHYQGVTVRLPHAGRAQAEAAVLGLVLADQAGLDLAAAAARLSEVQVPGGRFRVHPGRPTIIDDAYNASPLSVRAALDALSNYGGRRVSVLGTMLELGPQAAELHRQAGEQARASADLTFGVGPFAQALGDRAYATVPELKAALLNEVQPDDVILLKASRGISWTPERRAEEGVGLDVLLPDLLKLQEAGK